MSNYIQCGDVIAFHPGYYIEEIIETIKVSKEDFASKLDLSIGELCKIIEGENSITTEIAEKLSDVTNVSKEFWVNTQITYNKIIGKYDKGNNKINEIFENIMENWEINFPNKQFGTFLFEFNKWLTTYKGIDSFSLNNKEFLRKIEEYLVYNKYS